MPDIDRRPDPDKYTEAHMHTCPNCGRNFTCGCHAQPAKGELVCVDCERATYDPTVHGGTGEKNEA